MGITAQAIISRVKGSAIEHLVQNLLLRHLPKASYSDSPEGHFGLAFDLYTHFTSPIRRYPDLMVHRLLFESVGPRGRGGEKAGGALKKNCISCSLAEEGALKAEREGTSLAACAFMHNKVGHEFDGVVSGAMSAGAFVKINPVGVDGMIHVSNLGSDFFVFEESTLSLVGKRTGKRIAIGDLLRVKIKAVNIPLRRIDLVLV